MHSSFFQFWEIWSQTIKRSRSGFPFNNSDQATYWKLEAQKKSNSDMFYKNEQSSVIQYAWPMCDMKEE